jgi:hypothetical protein
MINIELKDQPIVDTPKYNNPGNIPTVLYGAVVKDEYDDQRLINDQADYYTHSVKDIDSGNMLDIYFRAVRLNQPLLALKILSDFKKTTRSEKEIRAQYEHLLSKFDMSCSDQLGMLYEGCLPIDGGCIKQLSDRKRIDVLSYNFDQYEWYNRFSSLGIYILY